VMRWNSPNFTAGDFEYNAVTCKNVTSVFAAKDSAERLPITSRYGRRSPMAQS
jgi:hypothetical protein